VSQKKIVLYADDDVDDKLWVADACKAVDGELDIQFVNNGKEALQFLDARADDELPALIVLDPNMPELDGRQTLQRIKAHDTYKNIPVVIVTTSSNSIDKEMYRRLGASHYLTKPDSYTEWQQVIRQLEPFIR
jgi:CheY-like chemotaxis protein